MIGSFLGLPPLVTLVIALALATYLIYHIATAGVAPLPIILLAVCAFALARSLFRMLHKPQKEMDD
jgi:positive regulator of sigma E activity